MDGTTSPQSNALKGKVALVTGGGRGIGRAITEALAAAGAVVAVLARSADELQETARLVTEAGGRAVAFPADVTDSQAVQSVISKVTKSLGPIDLLVNNAGTPKPFGPFWETDVDEWWQGMEVNVFGSLLCTRFVLPQMVSRRQGRIVNIVSGAGVTAMTYFSSYVCSKTALIRFTECLALECKGSGVSIFALAPGTVRTAMSEYSLNSEEGKKWLPWFRRLFDEQFTVPADRPAKLVLELASGRADKLSGRCLSVYDDLEQLVNNSTELDQRNLYALKVERLPGPPPNPALASIFSAARKPIE